VSAPGQDDATPRVQPIRPRDWPAGMAEALAAAYRPTNPRHPPSPLDPASPKGLNAMGVLAYHPELTAAYNNLISHALYFTTITPRQRELLILRVAHQRDSRYEWAQHVYQAGVVGISMEEIEQVRLGADAPDWDDLDAALLSAADELLADARISDATYAVLSRSLETRQLMDVVFTVGAYEVFAMAMRTFDVPLDEDLQRFV
jgi:alkylhydroperoxidase family enzyme